MVNAALLENERIDDLQFKGLKIIQKKNGFCFGVDAVLLSNFTDIRKNDAVIDLGTGSGIIPILLAGKTGAGRITGLEIQPDMCEMAERSVMLNNLGDRVRIFNGDIKNSIEYFGPSSFNVVVTNPPYISKGGGLLNPSDTKAVSRHEILCTLEDVIKTGARLLAPGGRFAMVHKPERLVDILCLMRQYCIEPKFLRFVHPSPYKKPDMLLIKGARDGNPELKVLAPLYVYDARGDYSDEIKEIYGRKAENSEQ